MQLELRNVLDAQLRAVDQLYQTTVLTLSELIRWMNLHTQLRIQSKQLELYQKELLQLTEHKSTAPQWYVAFIVYLFLLFKK
jgi:hypothetical protein